MMINFIRIEKLESEISTLRRELNENNKEYIMREISIRQNQIDYLKR